jgi:hypothetical protein
LKPTLFQKSDTTYWGFTAAQVTFIYKKLELSDAYAQKIVILEKENEVSNQQIKVLNEKNIFFENQLVNQKKIANNLNEQIIQYQEVFKKYKQSDRRAKFTKLFYKFTTFALAGTTAYLLLK